MSSSPAAQWQEPLAPVVEAEVDWPTWLGNATRVLAASLDSEITLSTIAELTVPALADWCFVDLLHPDQRVRRVALAYADPSLAPVARELHREYRADPTRAVGVERVLFTRRAECRTVTDEWLHGLASDPMQRAMLQAVRGGAYICAPLLARGRLLGTLLLVSAGSRRTYGEAELGRAVELADQAALAIDNARLHEAEQQARRRAERVQELTEALSMAVTQREVLRAVMERGIGTTGAFAGVVAMLTEDGAELEIAESTGYRSGCMDPGTRWPATASVPIADAVRDAEPVFVDSPTTWRERYGSYTPSANRSAAWAAIPLLRPGAGPRGALLWTFDWPHPFSPDDREHFVALARLCAQALERARLHEAERQARRAAERAAGRLQRLQAVTAGLSEALTSEEVVEVVVAHGLSTIGAKAGSVALLDEAGGELVLAGTFGYPEEVVQRYRRVSVDAEFPLAEAVRLREPIILETAEQRDARYPSLRELRRANGSGPMASVPLLVRGRVIGALGLNFPDYRVLEEEDGAFLTALAHQCAQALERARLYEAERQARAEAEEANRAKSAFLASMSHELRTPLNAIGGYTQLLELGVRGPVTDEQRQDLHRIQRSQHHLLSLINDVLNFAKVEAGKLEIVPRTVPLCALLADLEALVAPQLAAKRIDYCVECCDERLAVYADPEKARQILLNLVSNAIKFTGASGRISIRCAGEEEWMTIQVTDTGIGIPADKLGSIFEPFVQLNRSLTSSHEGAGLGLAISRDLARAMGGNLSACSRPGEGSTFVLRLPRATADPLDEPAG